MRRLCSRPGCSAAATTVFGFDPGTCAVWLGVLTPDQPRDAGDLCDRHAASMKPPRGWALEDRRGGVATPGAAATEKPSADRVRKAAVSRSGERRAGATAGAPKVRRRRERAPRDGATAPLPFDGADAVVGQGSKWAATAGSQRAEVDGARWAAAVSVPAAGTRVGAQAVVAEAVEPVPAEESATVEGWTPRFDRDDDLDGLLDAKTPLLGRAFRNIRSA